MQPELVVGIVFGSLSILLGIFAIFAAILISKRTDKLIQTEDARAKQIIDEGGARTQALINKSDERMQQTQGMIKEGNVYTQTLIQEENGRAQEIITRMDERAFQSEERFNRQIEFLARILNQDRRRSVSGVREKGPEYKPK